MLNKGAFKAGLKKLVTEYANKGFAMSEDRISQWYSCMKDMSDEEYNKKIDFVLKNCTYAPTMADIFKAEIRESNSAAYEDFKYD